jgi:hypothetical protein
MGELAVVGGPVTRQAVRLRVPFRNGQAIDLEPLEVGPQFPILVTGPSGERSGRAILPCWFLLSCSPGT